jgi:hypothetical protein
MLIYQIVFAHKRSINVAKGALARRVGDAFWASLTRKIALAAIFIVAGFGSCFARGVAHVSVDWSVHNRFRLFRDDERIIAKENLILMYLEVSPNLKSSYQFYYHVLQATDRYSGNVAPMRLSHSPDLFSYTRYDREAGDYSSVDKNGTPYPMPRSQLIDAKLVGTFDSAHVCTWLLQNIIVAQARCGAMVKVVLPYPKGQFAYEGTIVVKDGAIQLVSQEITSSDILIVAMGDSYAAGEGSPDRPTDVSKMRVADPFDEPETWWQNSIDSPKPRKGALPPEASADWWSVECHRSLFSPQVIAAMKIASDDRHRSVTFLSYACAGAAVLDGLLTPQQSPPGTDQIAKLKVRDKVGGIEGNAATYSQLQRAVLDLCELAEHPKSKKPYEFSNKAARSVEYDLSGKNIPNWKNILYNHKSQSEDPDVPICSKWIRKPSLLFLTIGGNDVGFAGMAAWALTPEKFLNVPEIFNPANDAISGVAIEFAGNLLSWNGLAIVCPSEPYYDHKNGFLDAINIFSNKTDPRCNPTKDEPSSGGASYLTKVELPVLLSILHDFIEQSGLMDNGVVVQEAYPSPLRDGNNKICGSSGAGTEFADNDQNKQLSEPWLADRATVPSVLRDPTLFNLKIFIREHAAEDIEQIAFDQVPGHVSLYNDLNETQRPGRWVLAASPPEFSSHGICAGTVGHFDDDFGFPRAISPYRPDANQWQSTKTPASWKAYEPRARWLRTSNDSLLTEAVSVFNDGQVLNEALSGTIHPTAEGQAAVADQLYQAAKPYIH